MYGLINIKSSNNSDNTSYSDINALLDKETKEKKVKWSKLLINDKSTKMNAFIDRSDYTDAQKKLLKTYVKTCFNRKKLLKDKEVQYNTETGEIEGIINLNYNEQNKRFTLTKKHLNSTVKNTKKRVKKNIEK